MKTNYDLEIQWIYFPLHPETPEEGLSLEKLFAGRALNIPAMMEKMKSLMDAESLPFGSGRFMTYNSRLAQELAKWGDSFPKGQALHTALYQAYFVEGKNIGKIDELLALVEKVGLPLTEAKVILEERRFRRAIDEDWEHAWDMSVTGVPTFVAKDSRAVGAQPYEQLAQLVENAGAKRRS